MKENIHWHKPGTNVQENQRIVEQKIAQMGEFKTNDDTFIEDQKIQEITDGSNNEERKEYEDAQMLENSNMMYDIASKKYEELNDYEEKMAHDYLSLDKQFDSLESLSNKVKILSSSLKFDRSRFNLSKGNPLSIQEMEEFTQEVKEFEGALFLARNAYERDLKEYEALIATYQELSQKYQKFHAAWYPKNPELS